MLMAVYITSLENCLYGAILIGLQIFLLLSCKKNLPYLTHLILVLLSGIGRLYFVGEAVKVQRCSLICPEPPQMAKAE